MIREIWKHMWTKKALEYRVGTIAITVFYVVLLAWLLGNTAEGLLFSAFIIGTKFFWYGIHEYRHGKHKCPACGHRFRPS